MSGASPRGPGVVVGAYPGCEDTPSGGTNGQISYHIAPTGVDGNNCPTGGSYLSVDEINGIEQAINCVLTRDGLSTLPSNQLCNDPCMLFDAIDDQIDYKIGLIPSTTIIDIEDFCTNNTSVDPTSNNTYLGFDDNCNTVVLNKVDLVDELADFCNATTATAIPDGTKVLGFNPSTCTPFVYTYTTPVIPTPTPTPYSMPSVGVTDAGNNTHSVTVPSSGGPWDIWHMRQAGGIASIPVTNVANGATHTVNDGSINSSATFAVMLVPTSLNWTAA